MKKLIQFLALLFLLSSISFGQSAPGNITAAGTTCGTTNACVVLLQGLNSGSATITLNGTFVATIQFEGTTDDNPTTNTNWYAVQGAPIGSATAVTSASTNNVWTFNTANLTGIRARASAYTSGTAAVIIRASPASASKGGVGGGSSLPSGTQGEPLINTTGATTYATSPLRFDTTQFTGADFGTRAKNCFTQLASIQAQGGICDGTAEVGSPDMLVNPFDGAGSLIKPVLILPCTSVTTEVPIVVAAGTSRASNNPGHAELSGCSNGPGESSGAGTVGGSSLIEGSSFPKCGSTAATNTQCLTATGATGGNGTTLSGTVGATTDGTSGIVTVTGSSTAFTTQLTHGCYLMTPATPASTQAVGMIDVITSDTSLTLSMNQSTGGAVGAGATYATWCPPVSFDVQAQQYNGSVNQGGSVHDLTIDGANHAGSYGVVNYYAAELNRIYNVIVRNFTAVGIDIEGNMPQSSGPYSNLFVNPGAGCFHGATWDIVINGKTAGFQNGSPFGFNNVLIANGTGCDAGTTVSGGWLINGGNIKLMDLHIERTDPGIEIAQAPTCVIGCPLFAGNTSQPASIVIDRVDMSCNNVIALVCAQEIELNNSFAAPVSVSLRAISASSTTNVGNVVHDVNNSNTLTTPNNQFLATYIIDGSGKVSFTDANPADTLSNVAIDCYNLVCSGSGLAGGSTAQVQYKTASGAFGGSANFTFPNATSSGTAVFIQQAANASSVDALQLKRFTNTSPLGNLLNGLDASAASVFKFDVLGNGTALSYTTSGTNGGMSGTEGNGSGLSAGTGTDLFYADSTLHSWHVNSNNVDLGQVATLAATQTFATTVTGNLSAGTNITDANSSNNNTNVGVMGGVTGTSTGGMAFLFYDVSGTGDCGRVYSGGSVAAGVYTVGTLEEEFTCAGAGIFGAGTNPTTGTSGGWFAIEGTSPTGTSTNYGMYNDSTLHCPDLLAQSVNLGCAVGETAIIAANTITKALGTTSKIAASSITDNGSTTAFAETARGAGVVPYFQITIPADTAQTASTESPGFQTITGTRTWATTGTVALQREFNFVGPTYASAGASQTFTDAFTLYSTPPIPGTNAIFTRGHTLGIVDSTSAATAITGGLVVATTLGTAATSVGIGGGNVNAGGIVTAASQAIMGTAAGSPGLVDKTIGFLASAMGAQSSATCTTITGMNWNIAANKNYVLRCEIPMTLAASATIQYCINGPGTATSYSLMADGDLGTAGIWSQVSTLAQTTYQTKTNASAAVAANSVQHVWASIQNGATASGTQLALQTAANGTNNITVGANATCELHQVN